MLIYQVLTRLWRSGKMSGFDQASFDYLRSLGVSHVWYTGIIRHSAGRPYVKGNIGSPYSIIDYYDVNPYLADNPDSRMLEFEDLVRRTHEAGLKVIIDFVPNHVSPEYSDGHGGIKTLHRCDYDWTDTDKIDYDSADNWDRLLAIVYLPKSWFSRYCVWCSTSSVSVSSSPITFSEPNLTSNSLIDGVHIYLES